MVPGAPAVPLKGDSLYSSPGPVTINLIVMNSSPSLTLNSLVLMTGLTGSLVAAGVPPAAGPVAFQDGDTLVFLGDSITHSWTRPDSYCGYVETFYYTRYPRLRLRVMNAGVSGSRVQHALARFDQAVARHRPTYVILMLGMNDAEYSDFDRDRFQVYADGMRRLLDRIAELPATAIPMVPTLLDYRNVELTPGNSPARKRELLGNVATLGYYGTWLREEALARGLPLVDQAAGFNRFLRSIRQTDPHYMLAPDAIHPNPAGLWVMAHTLVETLETNRFISTVDIFPRQGRVEGRATGGTLSQVERDQEVIRFTFRAESLPWVPPPEADADSNSSAAFAARHLNSGAALSRERLRLLALASNVYELKIDGTAVGRFDHVQLADGIDLQDHPRNPAYRQARAVAELNAEKTRGPMFRLGVEYERVSARGTAADEKAVAACEAEIRRYEELIYAVNQPVPHTYELAPVPP